MEEGDDDHVEVPVEARDEVGTSISADQKEGKEEERKAINNKTASLEIVDAGKKIAV